MSETNNIIENFYEKFVLRDIMGKIVPGSLPILTTYFWLAKHGVTDKLQMNIVFWFLFISFSWILAFILQSIGEKTKMLKYYSQNMELAEWYKNYNEFISKASTLEKCNLERQIISKEACGNTFISLLLSGAISLMFYISTGNTMKNMFKHLKVYWPLIIVYLLITAFSKVMHNMQVRRQDEYIKSKI